MDPTTTTTETPEVPEGAAQAGGKRSAWMSHVMKTKSANKGKSLTEVLKMASKTYKKSGVSKTARKTRKGKGKKFLGMFGGMVAETASPVTGGRRSRKGKKGSRKH